MCVHTVLKEHLSMSISMVAYKVNERMQMNVNEHKRVHGGAKQAARAFFFLVTHSINAVLWLTFSDNVTNHQVNDFIGIALQQFSFYKPGLNLYFKDSINNMATATSWIHITNRGTDSDTPPALRFK